MAINKIGPREFQESVHRGFERFENFRNARLMFIENYVGNYYDRSEGQVGENPLNMIFNAIRVLIPNIVMQFPTHKVRSNYMHSRDYADMLSKALAWHDQRINITDVYRRVVVDAVFTLGIMKTGLAESDSVYGFEDGDNIDAGTIYTEAVDFDNFVVDPMSREHRFRDARWMGDRIRVPRKTLLDSGLYRNKLIEQLPTAGDDLHRDDRAEYISKDNMNGEEDFDLEDLVEVVELWVPSANALVTVPGARDVTFDKYLRVTDYYGPESGPYTLLALTPPVPGNPLPIPMVGIWYDLHVLINRMAKKVVDQADRQKDILLYRRAAADDAQEMIDASDGEAIAVDDPDSAQTVSFGGQQQSNEVHLAHLQDWFNMISANPEGVGGRSFDADSATEARILANNANIGLEDMKDSVYRAAAEEARKRAWYMHTDPLIEVPLIQRQQVPAQVQQDALAPNFQQSTVGEEVQTFLTPEARRGDFLDFTFSIEPESMGRRDGQSRLAQAMDFAVRVLPAVMQAAQSAMMIGMPFNAVQFVVNMAKDMGIEWMDQVLDDPAFQQKIAAMVMGGPSPGQSPGVLAPQGMQAPNAGLGATLQNGQPGQVMGPGGGPSPAQEAQQGAVESQRQMKQESPLLGAL